MYVLSADLVQHVKVAADRHPLAAAGRQLSEDFYVAYLLDQLGVDKTHYAASNATLTNPWDGHAEDPAWWLDTMMGIHPIKETATFIRCFESYRPMLEVLQKCFDRHSTQPVGAQVAACSRPMPSFAVHGKLSKLLRL